MMHIVVMPTDSDMPCGFDYESFLNGWYCPQPTSRTLVDAADRTEPSTPEGFHYAHLCDHHAEVALSLMRKMGDTE